MRGTRLLLLLSAFALQGYPAAADSPAPVPAAPAEAGTLVAARAIRSTALIGPEDVRLVPGATPGALADPLEAIGKEARVTIYAGRPIRAAELAPPALVARNATVILVFTRGGLFMQAEGRALERGGAGDRIRVMNLDSRLIVTGRIAPDGTVEVSP